MKESEVELVDYYDEDEVDINYLLRKPTSFIVLGKPFSGKSTIATKLAKDWNCPLINAENLLLEAKERQVNTKTNPELHQDLFVTEENLFHLLEEKLSLPELENTGYVLVDFPSIPAKSKTVKEQIEMTQNFRLKPKIIIHIKIPDEDVIKRKTNARLNPLTGTLHVQEEYKPWPKIAKHLPHLEENYKEKKLKIGTDEEPETKLESVVSGEELEKEKMEFELLSEKTIENLLVPPECLENNVVQELTQYNLLFPYIQDFIIKHDKNCVIEIDGNLPPVTLYEGLLTTINQMAFALPIHPLNVNAFEEADAPYDWTAIFGTLCHTDPVAPLFPWRQSRWLKRCPIQLSKGSIINGKPSNAVIYRDKIYFLSSEENVQIFLSNPRSFLLPPMPKHPERFLILGHNLSGKTPVCTLLSKHFHAKVVDFDKLLQDYINKRMEVILYNVWLNTVCEAIEDIQVKETLQQAILQESIRKAKLEERARMDALEEGLYEMLMEEADRTGQDLEQLKESEEYVYQIKEHLENEMEILLSKYKDKLYGIGLEISAESTPYNSQSETSETFSTPRDNLDDLTEIQKMLKDLYLSILISPVVNAEVDNEIQAIAEPIVDTYHPSVVAQVEEAENARKKEGLQVSVDEKIKLIIEALSDISNNESGEVGKGRWIIDNFPAEKAILTSIIENGWMPSCIIIFIDPTPDHSIVFQRWKDLRFERLESISSIEYEPEEEFIEMEEMLEEGEEMQGETVIFAEEAVEEVEEEEEEEKVDEAKEFKSKLTSLDEFFEGLPDALPPDGLVDIIKINIDNPLKDETANISERTSETSQTSNVQDEAKDLQSRLIADYIVETLLHAVVRISEGIDDHKTAKILLADVLLELKNIFGYQAKESDSLTREQDDDDLTATTDIIQINLKNLEDEDKDRFRQFGDTRHYCPVKLKENWILQPGLQNIEAKYRERIYRFSSEEARQKFLANPVLFTAKEVPLKAPPFRLFILGARGAGSSIQARFLAKAFNIFHANFREHLQEFLMAKTGLKLGFPHEVDDEQIEMDNINIEMEYQKEFMRTQSGDLSKLTLFSNNTEDNELIVKGPELFSETSPVSLSHMVAAESSSETSSGKKSSPSKPLIFTKSEEIVKEYLQYGTPLTKEVLEVIISPWWLEDPLRSTGFIIEGFPNTLEESQFLANKNFFPDAIIFLEVDESDIVARFLPQCLAQWHCLIQIKRRKRAEQKWILQKKRSAAMMARRRELQRELMEKMKNMSEPSEDDTSALENSPSDVENRSDEFDIEAILAEEFPEIDYADDEVEETEEEARTRFTNNMGTMYQSDEERLATVKEFWEDFRIPCFKVNGRNKPDIVTSACRKAIASFLENRESIFETTQATTLELANRLIRSGYKMQTKLGIWCPVQLYEGSFLPPYYSSTHPPLPVIHRHHIYYLSSENARLKFMLNPIKYLKQKQPKLIVPLLIAVVGPPKAGKTCLARRFENEYHMVRLSGGDAVRYVLENLARTKLAERIFSEIQYGKAVTDKSLIGAFEMAIMSPQSQQRGVILDGFPLTMEHVKGLVSVHLIPFIIIELKVPLEESLTRIRLEKISKEKSFPLHDSEEFIQLRYEAMTNSIISMRKYYQHNHRNWIVLDATCSKWWLYRETLKHLKQVTSAVENYIMKTQEDKPVRISHMAMTAEELRPNLGVFGQYCPVSLAKDDELIDCSRKTNFQFTVEYKTKFYDFSSEEYMELFLSDPDCFLPPNAPRLPPPFKYQPTLMTFNMIQSLNSRLSIAFGGYCPVTYLEGYQTYDSLVKGLHEFGVWYEQKTYLFTSEAKREKFLK